jgi:hypothetical protein
MPFDEARYVQEFMKGLRGAHTLPDDLLARYAITLPAADAEVAARVAAVRKYWNKAATGQTHTAQAAKMCRAEDERLRAQHGAAMDTQRWWKERQAELSTAAHASIETLAEELRQAYGQLGVVTAGRADILADKLNLTHADAVQAAGLASLKIVDKVALPESAPIAAFPALLTSISQSGVASVPELVHPGTGPFRLLDRYACLADPNKRLDVMAVDAQSAEAAKRGVSVTDNACREALKILRRALAEGVDLRDVALFHLMAIADKHSQWSANIAAAALEKAGLAHDDAAVLAVVLHDRSLATAALGVDKVRELVTSGQLNEASQIAASLKADSDGRAEAMAIVTEARQRLTALLDRATQALAIPDESAAAAALREAAVISAEDADAALAGVPLAPPADLRLVGDAALVKLFWRPASGHDDATTYEVRRAEERAPAAPGDGAMVYRGTAQTCADEHAPVARVVHYAVFAISGGRPGSRPATAAVTLLPPVSQLRADVGESDLSVHWSAHPHAQAVVVTRRADGGRREPVPVRGSECHLTGLPEGEVQHLEVTAVYRGLDGAELRSPVAQINARPQSAAKPIPKLRARTIDVSGAIRLRVSWTPVDKSEVRIMRSDSPPPWTAGTWVTPEQMTQYGQEVTGRRVQARTEVAIEADVPVGVHHLVPFSIGGTGIVVGSPTSAGVTEPVRHLVATPFATHATVSWQWPPTAQLAEVCWELDENADCFVIGQAQYRSEGGARVPLGRGPCRVEVRALIMADGASFTSPPVRAVINSAVDVSVHYTVSSPVLGPFGGRAKKVTFTSDEGCASVRVRMVATPGRVMPSGPDGGFVLLDTTLDLAAGAAVEHQVSVPRSVKRPYWVRCFVTGGKARLIDPPVSSLKET